MAQRAALLDLVFGDLYGERRLVAEGLVPAELVLGHPAFLRPCVGMHAQDGHRMFLTAVDVARDGHGEFRALGDRIQAPSGLGYAMVNRTILSRVLPTLHRELGSRAPGRFLPVHPGRGGQGRPGRDRRAPGGHPHARPAERDLLRARLSGLLPRLPPGRGPRPGGDQQPGVAPVPGGLRSGGRGHPRVDDQWCDPVELRADSLLGVPGLLEVARRGRVTVVNPLGSGVVEDPALTGLLESLAPVRCWARSWPSGAPRPGGVGSAEGLRRVLGGLST